jgi:hypothetical protein
MNVNIRYLWLAIALSALIPTMSVSVPVLASSQDTLSITGNGDTASMALKATESNGNTENVDNFELTAANVLQIEEDDDVRITNDVNFDKARTVDVNDNEKAIDIDDDGNVDFDDYPQGTYVLRVITENGDRKLYEGIVVIGPENKDQVKKIIEKTVVEITVDIDCGKGFVEKNGECVKKPKPPSICYFNPDHKDCEPKNGKCPPGFGMNENDRCIPHGKCPDGYGRADDDETGKCFKKSELKRCDDGSIRLPQYCKENRPTPSLSLSPTPEPCEGTIDVQTNQCIPEPTLTPEPTPELTPEPTPNALARSLPTTPTPTPEVGIDCEVQPELCEFTTPTEPIEPTPLPTEPNALLGESIEGLVTEDTGEEDTEEEEEVEEEEPEEPEEEEREEPEEEESGGDDEASFGN